MAPKAWDGDFGRELPVHFTAAGLVDVDTEARTPYIHGATPAAHYLVLSVKQLRPAFVASGGSQDDLGNLIEGLGHPDTMVTWMTMVSAWGRRPP